MFYTKPNPSVALMVASQIACATVLSIGCDIAHEQSLADESNPPYQDLDAGNKWPGDSDTDPDADEPVDLVVASDGSGSDSGTDSDSDWCLDIGWEAYQVDGNCPDLPATGMVAQDGDCLIQILGDLGLVIGGNGAVSGAYVTTDSCTGVAAVDEFPTVSLNCLVSEASCQVELVGGTDNGFND
jgi:hypothetical protein